MPTKNYVIVTDSACDIVPATLAEWGVQLERLTFRFTDEDREYIDGEIAPKDFYDRMRRGGVAKTAAVNVERFVDLFEKNLSEGKDVLYLGFSTGLSTTYNSGRLAAEQLREKYPDREIYTLDTLSASAGEGLLVYLVAQKAAEGVTIQELYEYAKELVPSVCHWFTVDDLVYLKRGGRVSPAAAFFGNMLGIKPVMHVDNEGKLIPVEKVRGRRSALAAMAARYKATAKDPAGGTVFISHADCDADVALLSKMLKEQCGAEVKVVTSVGTVIGAHSGPGTLALFFIGKER